MSASDTSGVVVRTSDWSETSLIVTWFTRDFGKLRTVAKGAYRPKSSFRGKLDLFYLNDIVFVPSRRGDLHTLSECYIENPFPHIRERLDAFTAASYCCELVDLATEPEGPVPPLFELLTESLAALDVACPRSQSRRESTTHPLTPALSPLVWGEGECKTAFPSRSQALEQGSTTKGFPLPSRARGEGQGEGSRSPARIPSSGVNPLFIARFDLLALDALGFRPDVDQLPLDAGTRRIMSDLLDNAPGLARLRLTATQHHQIDSFITTFIGQQFGRLPKSRRLLRTSARKEG